MANTTARPQSVTVGTTDVSLLRSAAIGRGPISDLAIDGETLVVTNFGDNSLAVLGVDGLDVRGGIATGQPFAVALSDSKAFVAVSSASDDAITVIDTEGGHIVAAYPMAGAITAVASSPDGKRIYTARGGPSGADVAVIDVAAERVGIIAITSTPDASIDALCIDTTGRKLFVGVSDSLSSHIVVVDVATGRIRRSIELGAPIRGLALGLDSIAYALTSDINDRGVLHVVDLVGNRVYATVSVGAAPMQLALSADGTRAFVVDYDKVHVVCTDTRTVIGAVSVGARPSCVAVSPGRLYVADYDGKVSSYAVASAAPMYAQFAAGNALAAPRPRELQAAGV